MQFEWSTELGGQQLTNWLFVFREKFLTELHVVECVLYRLVQAVGINHYFRIRRVCLCVYKSSTY